VGCFSTSSSKSSTYTGAQEKWLQKALSAYGPELGKGQDIYAGERVAPLSQAQQELYGGAGAYTNYFQPFTPSESPTYGQAGTTLSDILQGNMGAQEITPEQSAAFYKSTMEAPALYNLSKYQLPGVRESYAGPGNFWSSARAKQEAETTGDVWRGLSEQRGKLDWDTLLQNQALAEAKAGRALSAIPLAESYTKLPTEENLARLSGLGGTAQLLAQPQVQRQAEIQANMEKFAEENRLTDPESMQILLSLLGMNYSTGSSTGAGLGYAGLTSLLGGIPSGIGSYYGQQP
jgi:hypothetical protein